MGVPVKWGISERSGMKSVRNHIFVQHSIIFFIYCAQKVCILFEVSIEWWMYFSNTLCLIH